MPWRFPLLALGALLVTVSGVFVVKRHLERDPNAGIPDAVKAERAMRDAEEATGRGDLDAAGKALSEAEAAIDGAVDLAPEDMSLSRARLAILDRAAQLARRRQDAPLALRYAHRTADWAGEILKRHPTDERAALDALSTANGFADESERARVPAADVRRGLESAASAVPAAATASPAVQLALSGTWLRLARGTTVDLPYWDKAVAALGPNPSGLGAVPVLAAAADAAERRGDLPSARRLDTQALAAAEAEVASHPGDPGAARLLEGRLLSAADRLSAAGDAAAGPLYARVVASRRARLAKTPASDDGETRRELARALTAQGAALSERDPDAALAAYSEAAQIAAPLLGEGRRTRAVALGNRAQILGRLNRWDEARAAAREALDVATELADDPQAPATAEADRAHAALRAARLFRGPGGDRAKAVAVAREAKARLEKAVVPRNAEDRRTEALSGLEALLKE